MKSYSDVFERIKNQYFKNANLSKEVERVIFLYLQTSYPNLESFNNYELQNITHLIDLNIIRAELIPLTEQGDEFLTRIRKGEMEEYVSFLINVESLLASPKAKNLLYIEFKKSYGFDTNFISNFKTEGIKALTPLFNKKPQYSFIWKFSDEIKKQLILNYTKYLITSDNKLYTELNASNIRSTKGLLQNIGNFDEYEARLKTFLETTQSHLLKNKLESFNRDILKYSQQAEKEISESIDAFLLQEFNFSLTDKVEYFDKSKTLHIPLEKIISGISKDVAIVIQKLYKIRNLPAPQNQRAFKELLPVSAKAGLKLKDIFSAKNAKPLKKSRLKNTKNQKWFYLKTDE